MYHSQRTLPNPMGRGVVVRLVYEKTLHVLLQLIYHYNLVHKILGRKQLHTIMRLPVGVLWFDLAMINIQIQHSSSD